MGIVPARGGSKGIRGKNLVPLLGKPLVVWTIEEAARSGINRLVLSSEDDSVIRIAKRTGQIEIPFVRPKELATDLTPAIDVVIHALRFLLDHEDYKPDAVMLLQPTSPLRTANHIDEAISLFEERNTDSLVSVVRVPHNMTRESQMQLDEDGWLVSEQPIDDRSNLRQLKQTRFARNGAAIYLARASLVLDRETMYGDKLVGYEMRREESIDIDDDFDLQLCEWLILRREELSN